MGALDYGARSYLQRSSLLNPGPGNVGLPTGFLENLNAAAEDFDFSYLSTSEAKNLGPVIDQQLRQIHQSQNPDVRFRPGYSEEEPGLSLLQKGTLMALTALPTNIMIAKSMTEDGELPWTYEYRKES
ncbi:uncharacterized protein METZ01_LOCUS93345, partial [marine metagenome]